MVVDITAADIITGAVERITGAVEAITAGDFIQEVSSPGTRPESIIPSTNLLKNSSGETFTPIGPGLVTATVLVSIDQPRDR
jgi:hypothetical protein